MQTTNGWTVGRWLSVLGAAATVVGIAAGGRSTEPPVDSGIAAVEIRCAVIGGMVDTGLFEAAAKRFEQRTGIKASITAWGPKREIADAFQRGEADLITMHASDTIVNLVADGYGVDPQPWTRNDLLLVGPPADPAGVRGMQDAAEALRKIAAAKAKLLMHGSLGANEVLTDVLAAGRVELDPNQIVSLPSDRHREMLKRAKEEQAYALVGRIPFLNAKIPNHDMEIMVQGDPRLRRPYVVVVAAGAPSTPRIKAARELAAFLRSPETQKWLLEFGRGRYDDRPLFFPVELNGPRRPAAPDATSEGKTP